MTAPHTPLLLRLSVVVGAVTLLLGIVGAVAIVVRDRRPAEGEALRLRLQGAVAGRALAVEVRWAESGSEVRQRARRSETENVWILPPLPAERTITIVVLDTDEEPPRLIALREFDSSSGAELDLRVPGSDR